MSINLQLRLGPPVIIGRQRQELRHGGVKTLGWLERNACAFDAPQPPQEVA
jgi:hypothetical protein